jgi:hypothetical protein
MQPTRRNTVDRLDRFRVEPWIDAVGAAVERWPGLWRHLAGVETRRLSEETSGIEIHAPIFVCGLARSGTTILLECLAAHPDTATHRYRDYPGVLAPVVWNRIAARLYSGADAPVERAHGDGIAVTPDSPEAVAEMLWMAFDAHAHDPARDNRVGRGGMEEAFAAFFRDHVRKLLWLRGGRRYLSKGNYDLARMDALLALFPDARFIVPIRDPVTHIASLMRQHMLFATGETRHPAALRYMRRIGHFEFGLDRRPINLGNTEVTAEVERLWRTGREVEGWSLYWADVHGFLAGRLESDTALRRAVFPVSYETLCIDPQATLGRIFAHADLAATDGFIDGLAARIRAPSYSTLPFGETERAAIEATTKPALERVHRWIPDVVPAHASTGSA